MGLVKIYEIQCDTCLTILKHAYSAQEAREIISDDPEWHWFMGRLFCSDKCNTEKKR